MRKSIFILLILAMMLTASCDNMVYDKYNQTPIAGWEKTDHLSFSVPKMEYNGMYGIDLGLRINRAYPFMGLTLIVERKIFPRKEVFRDTLNCNLIDKNGNAKGRGTSFYQYKFHVNDIQLNRGDSIEFTVKHNMKREILPGISDIGIIIERK